MHRDSLGTVVADPARRGQLDDRRPRHRAFRAHRRRSAAPTATRCTACRCGWRCRPTRRRSTPAFAHHAAEEFPIVQRQRQDRARRGWAGLRRALAGRDRVGNDVRRRRAARPAPSLPLDAGSRGARDLCRRRRDRHRRRPLRPADSCWCSSRATAITIRAVTDEPFRRSLGGAPMDGPRHIWWNFVSSRKDRIEQAKADWKAGALRQGAGRRDRVHPAAGPRDA